MLKNTITEWKMGLMRHDDVVQSGFDAKTINEILSSDCKVINADVPGNFELDMSREGMLPEDLYFGTNILSAQTVEDMHLWYFSEFEYEDNGMDAFLLFEGIDTAANIYIDGELAAFSENMFVPCEIPLKNYACGRHEVVVHIIPASVYVRDFELEASAYVSAYHSTDAVLIRKPPYMYGWDIMARTVSAGLWKDVSVVYKPKNRMEDLFYSLGHTIHDKYATIRFRFTLHTDVGNLQRFSVRIKGECRDSRFEYTQRVFCVNNIVNVRVENPIFWWPRNYGEPNMYNTEVTLYLDGQELETQKINVGLRKVELIRTSCAGKDGKFEFLINNKRIFALGTNWVPTDSFPSRHKKYELRGLELTKDVGCNMIRCWGGNAYPSDEFYDYCDKNGILVWQDFAMACGRYPQDERFCNLMRIEAEHIVKAFRNHPSLALWSGDNECDSCGYQPSYDGKRFNINHPEKNIITRSVIPEVIRRLDNSRPYLPSSPYYDDEAFATDNPSENHLWGPRDYFKGDFYYKQSVCHFASETGYHGCPSPETLKKFISPEHMNCRGDGRICTDEEWLTHATCVVPDTSDAWSYRISLMTRQVERLFGKAYDDISVYALQSQISQAEAMKFFVEHFRIGKWYRTGIIWWNIIDGWPQVSDAVVDWYGTKKMAYHYIKRAQTPVCLMFDEPDTNGNIHLHAVNDTRSNVKLNYIVSDAVTGEKITCGTVYVPSDGNIAVEPVHEESRYYRIEWSGDAEGVNHFRGKIGDGVSLDEYTAFMKNMGFTNELEGF